MEFEKDIPATAEEIALADVPKLTLQPLDANIAPEQLNTNYSHDNEASFSFESENTEQQASPSNGHSHILALLIAAGCALVFAAVIAAMYLLR